MSLSPKWSIIVEPGFMKSFHPQTLMYVHMCVSALEAVNNKSHEKHA